LSIYGLGVIEMKKNYLLIKDGKVLSNVSDVVLSKAYREAEEKEGVEFREVPDDMKDDIKHIELSGSKMVVSKTKKDKHVKRPSLESMVRAIILKDNAKLAEYKTYLESEG
jgi:hypothetical protein